MTRMLTYEWTLKDIVRLSTNLSELYSSIKQFSDQYLIFEMTLIKLLQFDKSVDIEKFLDSNIVESATPVATTKKIAPKAKSTPKVETNHKQLKVEVEKKEVKEEKKRKAVPLKSP